MIDAGPNALLRCTPPPGLRRVLGAIGAAHQGGRAQKAPTAATDPKADRSAGRWGSLENKNTLPKSPAVRRPIGA
jgi:hypothetical protein